MTNSRILVVSERYWPDGRGAELATHLIIEILSKEYDITVVTGSIDIHRVPNVEYLFEPLLSKKSRPILWFNTLHFVKTTRFKELFKKHDVVYIPRFAYPLIPYAKKNKKVIVHLHDYALISNVMSILAPYEEHKYTILNDDLKLLCIESFSYCIGAHIFWWLPKLAKKWSLLADKIICVSKRQAKIIIDQIPELKDKIEVVYNPLPPELINNEPRKELSDTPTFLYVGGDSYVKGFHILLQSMKLLGKQGVKAKFILTNKYSPECLPSLRRLSEKYRNLEIEVVGRVEYSKLLELHRRTWALIFPSIWEEPLPYAVVEAAVLGTIPIASKVGGVVELLGDTVASRYLFTSSKYIGLVEKLIDLSSLSIDEVKSLSLELRREVLTKVDLDGVRKSIAQVFKRGCT